MTVKLKVMLLIYENEFLFSYFRYNILYEPLKENCNFVLGKGLKQIINIHLQQCVNSFDKEEMKHILY